MPIDYTHIITPPPFFFSSHKIIQPQVALEKENCITNTLRIQTQGTWSNPIKRIS